jgi:outer membrane protein assembly factor BamB
VVGVEPGYRSKSAVEEPIQLLDGEIHFPSGRIVKFEQRVMALQEFEEVVVVLLDFHARNCPNENVYGMTKSGAILWQIQSGPGVYTSSPFTSISKEGAILQIYNWDGYLYDVDPTSGLILKSMFVK